jgi:hypothetical protein
MKKAAKKPIKIAVQHYTEITDSSQLNGLVFDNQTRYITNEGGKQYIVEIWG